MTLDILNPGTELEDAPTVILEAPKPVEYVPPRVRLQIILIDGTIGEVEV
jgi:hypothetical protein